MHNSKLSSSNFSVIEVDNSTVTNINHISYNSSEFPIIKALQNKEGFVDWTIFTGLSDIKTISKICFENNKGIIRKKGPDYSIYSIFDLIVDIILCIQNPFFTNS